MINSSVKDKVVYDILKSAGSDMHFEAYYKEKSELLDISIMEYMEIIKYLDRKGFIRATITNTFASIRPNVELYDLYNEGGFVAKDDLLKANFKKLDMELFKLEQEIDPSLQDRIKKIAEIASAVSSAVGLFKF